MAASRKSMLKALRTAVLADSVVDRANEQILLSLVARDLCDGDGRLTEWGQVNGISACTLEQQCELLGIPMSTLPSSAGKPEDMAMDHFVGAGARPVYDEGAMAWQLLFCLALRATLELGTDHWLTGYRQPENLQDEDQIRYSALSWPFGPDFLRTAPNALVVWRECILTTPLDQLVDNAETLKQWMYQETAWGRVYGNSHLARIHATADLLRFRELLGCRLAALTDFYFAEGRGSGWPDLVVMEPGDLRMVEVKKSDKLLASQIIALPRLRDEVGLDVSVLRFRG